MWLSKWNRQVASDELGYMPIQRNHRGRCHVRKDVNYYRRRCIGLYLLWVGTIVAWALTVGQIIERG